MEGLVKVSGWEGLIKVSGGGGGRDAGMVASLWRLRRKLSLCDASFVIAIIWIMSTVHSNYCPVLPLIMYVLFASGSVCN